MYNVSTKLLKDNLKLGYNALIYPLFIYCNVVWGSCCKTYLCNLNIIQKKLVRVMSFRNRFEHTTLLFSNYNMLTIENINKYMSLILVHIYICKYLHSENNNLFTLYEPMHYRTRLIDRNTILVSCLLRTFPISKCSSVS